MGDDDNVDDNDNHDDDNNDDYDENGHKLANFQARTSRFSIAFDLDNTCRMMIMIMIMKNQTIFKL